MELEKTLFRVHERLLSDSCARPFLKSATICLFVIGAIQLCMFIYSEIVYRGVSHCLQDQYSRLLESCPPASNAFNLTDPTTLFRISVCDADYALQQESALLDRCGMPYARHLLQSDGAQEGSQDGTSNDVPTTTTTDDDGPKRLQDAGTDSGKGEENYCGGGAAILRLQTSGTSQITTMPDEARGRLNITTANIIINEKCYASNSFSRAIASIFIRYEAIVINEIINTFQYQNITIKNLDSGETWGWNHDYLQGIKQLNIIGRLTQGVLDVLKVTIGLFITSAITSLYLKVTIICSPVFILMIISCMNRINPNQINRNAAYRVFPWVGIYLFTLDNQGRRPRITPLVCSFLMMIVVFYAIYVSTSLLVGAYMFFFKSLPQGIDEGFYAYQAIMEFAVMLFLRTRSSIKWFPKTSILMTLCYLMYVQETLYGFYTLAFSVLFNFVNAFLGLVLLMFEQPAMHWNPTYYYTPSIDRPRTLYFPLFSLNYNNDLPQLWTLFYPLHGRDFFTDAQLSYIDRNYLLLNQVLRGNVPNNAPGGGGGIPLPAAAPGQHVPQPQPDNAPPPGPGNGGQQNLPPQQQQQQHQAGGGGGNEGQQHARSGQSPIRAQQAHVQIEMQASQLHREDPINLLHEFDPPHNNRTRARLDDDRDQAHYQRLNNEPPHD